jgi:PPP family 3-phenylpropionic acid transporter
MKDRATRISLTLAMLLQFAVGGAVLPFLTLFLRDKGLTLSEMSEILSGASALLLVFPFFWGMMADRFIPLNRLFTILNVLLVVCLWLFSRQQTWLGLAITYMAFYACYNPSLVLLNPLSFYHIKNPRSDFGNLRAWGSAGWIVPSIIIYALLAANPQLDLTVTIHVAIGTALLMLGASFLLPHTPIGITHTLETDDPRMTYLQAIRKLAGNPVYLILLVVYFLIASSFSIQAIYSPALLEELGMERKWIGPAQCVGVVLEILLFRWQRGILHRISYAHTILIGCLCMLARHLIFAFSDNLTLLVASHLLTGLVIVFHHIGVSLVVNAIAPREVRSTAQTLLILFGSGLGPMTANWCVGLIAEATGQNLRMIFLFAGLMAAAGTAVIFLGARRLNLAAHAEDLPAQIPDAR